MTTATLEEKTSVLDRPFWSALALDWEKCLYLVLIVSAVITRFYDLGARVMSHDESLHTQYAWYLFKNGTFQHTPMMHGPLKFDLTAFVYWLFGDSDFTARIPTAIMGVVAVGLCFYYRKWLGRTGALVAAFLMLISPYQLYYSRYIRDEPYVMVWALVTVLLVLNYLDTRAVKYLYALTAVAALFYATMESSFIYFAIIMIFLGLFLLYDLVAAEWPRPELRGLFLALLVIGLVAGVLGVGLFAFGDRLGIAAPVAGQVQAPSVPGNTTPESGPVSNIETYIVLALSGTVLAGLVAVGVVARAFGREGLRRFPALDLIAILGLFALPQLAAFPVRALHRNPINYTVPPISGLNLGAFLTSDAGVTLVVTLALLALSLAVGLAWNPRVFIVCAAIFYGIYIPLFTTFFTNGGGLATGLIGSLGYWVEQQGVRRGSQPWYYYLVVNLPMYEFLPTIGALFALGLGITQVRRPAAPVAGSVDDTATASSTASDQPTGSPAMLGVETPPPPVDASPDAPWLAVDAKPASVSAAATMPEEKTPPQPTPFPALLFIGYWSAMALVAFSIAGEKMPWLTTHICLPMILLSGWAIGSVIDDIDWAHFRARRAWLVAVLLPVTLAALVGVLGTLFGSTPPFQGSDLNQLQATSAFISALVVAAIGLISLYRLGGPLGWGNVGRLAGLSFFAGLALLTARTAFIAAYINYDYANEFLVYAHGSRGVKTVMAQIEDISQRTTDGLNLKVAYDADVAWPMTWYFRNYKNQSFYGSQPTREALDAPVVIAGSNDWTRVEALLGDRYYKYEYIRMVWPMQDYFPRPDESIGARIVKALADRQMRQALFNIWWSRDYTLYGTLTNQSFDLAKWPLVDRMRMYVRKDIAAQIWNYGVGPAQASAPAQEDPYVKARQVIPAGLVFGAQGTGPSQFDAPRGVAVAPDGSIYVVDSRNNRVEKFDATGKLLLTWGRPGKVDDGTGKDGGTFNEPWGVAVAPDGSVYVGDLWNHRIQKFDANGQFIKMWGKFSQDGAFDSFYGPRGLAVDASGHLYVSDTGNDRIVVFDANGNGLATIGTKGFEPGTLDEPVGVAVTADGATIFVADTWNQRVQRFHRNDTGDYVFEKEWKVNAWFGQSLDNKPYLALDGRGRVYVTDPEGYRVLVFDRDGQFLATWGDAGSDASTFALLSGVTLDGDGNVLVVDAGNNRVMRFPPVK